MKGLISIMVLTQLTACNFTPVDVHSDSTQFDWMPSQLVWEHNIRTCRSQPVCNAADLFQR
jgi:hypothetical protein